MLNAHLQNKNLVTAVGLDYFTDVQLLFLNTNATFMSEEKLLNVVHNAFMIVANCLVTKHVSCTYIGAYR